MLAPTRLLPFGLKVENIKSAEAASIAGQSYQTFTGSVEKAGYTPLGIVGFNINSNGGSGQSGCTLYKCYMFYDSTENIHKYYVSFKNVSSTVATKIYAVLSVLYAIS